MLGSLVCCLRLTRMKPSLGDFDRGVLQLEMLRGRLAADRNEDAVKRMDGLAAFALEMGQDFFAPELQPGHFGLQVNRRHDARQLPLQRPHQVAIDARQQAIGELDDRDHRAQPRVHGAKLQTDIAATGR